MANPSNLYAEKVYAEHPIVLWALDDESDYISLITNGKRDIGGWTVENATATTGTYNLSQPFLDSSITLVEGDVPVGSSQTFTLTSQNLVNFQSLNSDLGTFCVGSYFYSNSAFITSIEIGYEYTDTTTALDVQHLKTFSIDVFNRWSLISGTFEIPQENTEFRAVIKITYSSGGATPADYQFYFNGVTVGQWSEEFNATSLGITPEPFPSTLPISIQTKECVPALSYGLDEEYAYYFVENNSILAKNTSIPMVYGAKGITKLIKSSDGSPSIIFPGKGFLNEEGKNKDYTIEFWLRLNGNTTEAQKIFGPIASTDGLYADGGFLTLLIGDKFKSYFVSEWYRPMLINIRLVKNNATVLLNGEEVISLPITTNLLELPSKLDINGKDQDWLGFYVTSDIESIEIDCFSIYSYQVPTTVAKRRFVYGQAVGSPEKIDSAYSGKTAIIDYPFADYTSNYIYPDFAKWQQGSFDNVTTSNTSLSIPQYELPEIFLDGESLHQLYLDNKDIQITGQDIFFTFRPNSSWNTKQCYFNFPKFNFLNDSIHSVFGIFSSTDLTSEETLFKIYNYLTGNYFVARKDTNQIHYYLNFNGIEEEIYTTDSIVSGEKFAVGIQIQELVDTFGGNVAAFFGNQNGLKMYVAGDNDAIFNFTGKIYAFNISTSYGALDVLDHFNSSGIVNIDAASELIGHTSSYTLFPEVEYDRYYLDIGAFGFWEDYIPLSYFAQYVKDNNGNTYYDLDFLQFNFGYPEPNKLIENETIAESFTYEELKNDYSALIQRTYQELDNELLTDWHNYEDMSQKAIKYYEYDTTNASIRAFLSLQYIAEGANHPKSYFTTTESPKKDGIIYIDDHPNWETTQFEIINNTLIYPSKNIDFNSLALVYHLDFRIRGILNKNLTLRKLEISSQALNNNSFNPIGTKFGINIYPYTKSGIYYNYKDNNPFTIYKGSTPYLYLTKNSGIELRGNYTTDIDRGLAIPINTGQVSNYKLSAIQLWMRYDHDKFYASPQKVFEIDYKEDTIEFYIISDSETGLRGRIYAKSKNTGQNYNGLLYYWNGSLVREPVLTIKEWGSLGIGFATSLNFDSYLGSINLNGPLIFNNIGYYQSNNLQQTQSSLIRPWLKVKESGLTNYDWQYWVDSFTWNGVLVISSSELYGVDPSDLYKAYTGTNKIIIDDNEGFLVNSEKTKFYIGSTWSTNTEIPV